VPQEYHWPFDNIKQVYTSPHFQNPQAHLLAEVHRLTFHMLLMNQGRTKYGRSKSEAWGFHDWVGGHLDTITKFQRLYIGFCPAKVKPSRHIQTNCCKFLQTLQMRHQMHKNRVECLSHSLSISAKARMQIWPRWLTCDIRKKAIQPGHGGKGTSSFANYSGNFWEPSKNRDYPLNIFGTWAAQSCIK
jgi:hypothetical protein